MRQSSSLKPALSVTQSFSALTANIMQRVQAEICHSTAFVPAAQEKATYMIDMLRRAESSHKLKSDLLSLNAV